MPYIAKKGLPFDYRGAIKVEDCKSSAEVMEKAGLDWEVAKCEVYSKFPVEEDVMNHQDIYKDHHFMGHDENFAPALYAKIPNGYATYRKDYGIPLGIVKERYTPVQNSEAQKCCYLANCWILWYGRKNFRFCQTSQYHYC